MGHVAVTINGRTYRFACGDGQESRVGELSAYIQGKLDALGYDLGRIGDERLLVMAALLIADELFEARAEQAAAPPEQPSQFQSIQAHPDRLRAALPPKPRQRKSNTSGTGLKALEPEPITLSDEQSSIAPSTTPNQD
jgi:cell division protein ZapA